MLHSFCIGLAAHERLEVAQLLLNCLAVCFLGHRLSQLAGILQLMGRRLLQRSAVREQAQKGRQLGDSQSVQMNDHKEATVTGILHRAQMLTASQEPVTASCAHHVHLRQGDRALLQQLQLQAHLVQAGGDLMLSLSYGSLQCPQVPLQRLLANKAPLLQR